MEIKEKKDKPLEIKLKHSDISDITEEAKNAQTRSGFLEASKLRKQLSVAPTFIPQNWWEQLQIVNDGTDAIYAYINNAWARFGSLVSKARAYRTGNQDGYYSNWWKVNLNTESYDNNNEFDSTTNYRFTVKEAGYYSITGQVTKQLSSNGWYEAAIYKNGSAIVIDVSPFCGNDTGDGNPIYDVRHMSDIVYLEKDDYIELYAVNKRGSGNLQVVGGSNRTFLSIHRLS